MAHVFLCAFTTILAKFTTVTSALATVVVFEVESTEIFEFGAGFFDIAVIVVIVEAKGGRVAFCVLTDGHRHAGAQVLLTGRFGFGW